MISDINSSGFLMMIMSNCGTIAAGHYLTWHNRCQWFRFECLTQTLKLNLCDFENKYNRQATASQYLVRTSDSFRLTERQLPVLLMNL